MTRPANRREEGLYQRVAEIIEAARGHVARSVNSAMVHAYWLIGREIVEVEQQGAQRAGYGEELIERLAARLSAQYGAGFGARTLERIRRFYLTFPQGSALSSDGSLKEIPSAVLSESSRPETSLFPPLLGWTHYKNFLIARMDQLSRSADLQARLESAPEWDLIICDEAHRMSAHFTGGEIDATRRYKLGQFLGTRCRNLLLMTATPHNGKEEDFQLFLALLDGDRFEGRFRDGVHSVDPSDLMRRMIKENLRRFDGSALFPERKSYTPQYDLSDAEAALYHEVTEYVREEMNRADRFADEETRRRLNVGFALMTLQRRLASSPEAIFRSLQRRRERLESRLRDERVQLRGERAGMLSGADDLDVDEDLDEMYEEAPQEERETVEERLVDNATAARTIAELEVEIDHLKDLEEEARKVRRSGEDAKWTQLNTILDDPLMVSGDGSRRKLVIFSEFRDTLTYLVDRVRTRLGRPEAVVEIHGGVTREDRRKVVHEFMNNPEVVVLIANDAAGEGVNLQRAHLMVNHDLPWNPNRLEQRFGRIHRIGQQEICHLWNLVAKDTREGDVYRRLLQKLELEREARVGRCSTCWDNSSSSGGCASCSWRPSATAIILWSKANCSSASTEWSIGSTCRICWSGAPWPAT